VGVRNKDSIYEWESSRSSPSVTNLRKLAAALNVDIHDLYRAPGGRRLLGDLRVEAGIPQGRMVDLMNKKLHLTGEKMKVTQTRISNWERAKEPMSNEYIEAYAAALGLTLQEVRDAVLETRRIALAPPLYRTPRIDRAEEDFKGVAAGSSELEFVYGQSQAGLVDHPSRLPGF
jgi:transcriptional regulator with XRE-family HTH domain